MMRRGASGEGEFSAAMPRLSEGGSSGKGEAGRQGLLVVSRTSNTISQRDG